MHRKERGHSGQGPKTGSEGRTSTSHWPDQEAFPPGTTCAAAGAVSLGAGRRHQACHRAAIVRRQLYSGASDSAALQVDGFDAGQAPDVIGGVAADQQEVGAQARAKGAELVGAADGCRSTASGTGDCLEW
jgi:hypothetical protein